LESTDRSKFIVSSFALTVAEDNLPPGEQVGGQWLLERLLAEQQSLSAVERFARAHERQDHHATPTQARYYRDLIPARLPNGDEQFAFEVDLDACSGCKACVAACHNLNGLEPNETWRGVGLLHGGTEELPVLQHVTTACHHCLEPACLSGCPVAAYEKDPVTGIVRHLDDQCIGCQYCILKCPYDVPKYSAAKGIVRKCDMCSTRLAAGEAPACVQSCPHEAIRIRIVDRTQTAEACAANLFLPGAPEPGYTLPSTVYKSSGKLPKNLLPTDYYAGRSQHAHWPLIVMLVLTQASVGAMVADQALAAATGSAELVDEVHRGAALLLGLLGLAASVLHLGRPRYAYRAWIGLRTSWLSREILGFGLFAGVASLYAAAPWASLVGITVPAKIDSLLGRSVGVFGIAGIMCSAMIYVSTRRPFWRAALTIPKFLLTGAILGLPIALVIGLVAAAASPTGDVSATFRLIGPIVCKAMIVATTVKLALEACIFFRLASKTLTSLKRTAVLLADELGLLTFHRFFTGFVGGIGLPLFLLSHRVGEGDPSSALFLVLTSVLAVCVSAVGEFLERYLFFTAVVAPKMPGVPAS
jgi:formate dehydrogenase iron-sulfur subunit